MRSVHAGRHSMHGRDRHRYLRRSRRVGLVNPLHNESLSGIRMHYEWHGQWGYVRALLERGRRYVVQLDQRRNGMRERTVRMYGAGMDALQWSVHPRCE
jgi:hypothetical protein